MSSYVASTASAPLGGTVISQQNVSEAGKFANARASDLKKDLNEGSLSLRIMALLGALAMMVVSLLGFLGHVLTLRWVSAMFEVYSFILGIVIVILEYGKQLSFFSRFEHGLYKHASFLRYVWGRGFLYFFAGTLVLSQNVLVDLVVGGYVCFVGIAYIWVGRTAAKKMGALRRSSVTPEQLQEKFANADVDGKGSLSADQFHGLTNNLGMDLTRREVESVFLQLNCEMNGRVSYETVLQWWNNEASEQDNFQATVI